MSPQLNSTLSLHNDLPDQVITHLNSYTFCTTYLTMYRAVFFNGALLTEPVILMLFLSKHYFISKKGISYIRTPKRADNFSTIHGFLLTENQDTNDFENSTLHYAFAMKLKGRNCQARVRILPLSQVVDPLIYQHNSIYGTLLVGPFTYYESSYPLFYFLNEFLGTVPLFYVLVYDSSEANSEATYQSWLNAVFIRPHFTMLTVIYFVYDLGKSNHQLSVVCENCNLCDPYALLELIQVPNTKLHLQSVLIQTREGFKAFPKVDFHNLASLGNLGFMSIRYGRALQFVQNILQLGMAQVLQYRSNIMELHKATLAAGENTTLYGQYRDFKYKFSQKIRAIDGCIKPVFFRGVSQPEMGIQNYYTAMTASIYGILVSRIERLRFVSCHEERSIWLVNLKEFFLAFDLPTWLGLIFSVGICCLAVTKFVSIYSKTISKCGKAHAQALVYRTVSGVAYQLVTCLLEQGCGLYQNQKVRHSAGVALTLFSLSTMFSILSNEYKGENIGRLTVAPPLTPFDDYKTLVAYNFSINLMPIDISSHFLRLGFSVEANQSKWYRQENSHEALPVVSKLWYLLNQGRVVWTRLANILEWESNTTIFYVNTSHLFPNWRKMKPYRSGYYKLEDFINTNLWMCYKQAAILEEYDANRVYRTFAKKERPVFYGKDAIFTNVFAYWFDGHFEFKFHRRLKWLSETGIFGWWDRFAVYVISLQSYNTTGLENHLSLNKPKDNTHTYILLFLLGICLSVAVGSFAYEIYRCTKSLRKKKKRLKTKKLYRRLVEKVAESFRRCRTRFKWRIFLKLTTVLIRKICANIKSSSRWQNLIRKAKYGKVSATQKSVYSS